MEFNERELRKEIGITIQNIHGIRFVFLHTAFDSPCYSIVAACLFMQCKLFSSFLFFLFTRMVGWILWQFCENCDYNFLLSDIMLLLCPSNIGETVGQEERLCCEVETVGRLYI